MMRRRGLRGAAAMEFGLWFPVILSVLIGVIDGGMAMATQHVLARAARDGARIGSMTIEPIPATGKLIEAAASDAALRSLSAAGVEENVFVEARWTTDAEGLAWITVDVHLDHRSFIGSLSPFHGWQTRSFSMLTQEQ